MSTRRERYQVREYQQRQRDFDNREVDPNELANRREMMGLPDPVQQTPEQRREDSVRHIQGESRIGEEIARYLPDARDRSHLVSHRPNQGFLVAPENQDRACLPNDGLIFRTNSGSTGCGLFTRLDSEGICCIQSDLNLLSSVAAIMRGKAEGVASERIVTESYAWLEYTRPDLLPANKVVVVDTNDNGDMELLKLGCEIQTSCPFIVRIHAPNETLPRAIEMWRLCGNVTITSVINGASLSVTSLSDIFHPVRLGVELQKSWEKMVIDCPLNTTMVYNIADILEIGTRQSQQDVVEVEIKIPPAINIHAVVNMMNSYPYNNWVPRAGDGPTRTINGRRASMSYNIVQNTMSLIDERV